MSALDDTYETDIIKGIITRKQADVLIELKALSDNLEQASANPSLYPAVESLEIEFNTYISLILCIQTLALLKNIQDLEKQHPATLRAIEAQVSPLLDHVCNFVSL